MATPVPTPMQDNIMAVMCLLRDAIADAIARGDTNALAQIVDKYTMLSILAQVKLSVTINGQRVP